MTHTFKLVLGAAVVVVATAILVPWSPTPPQTETGTTTVRIDDTHTFSYSLKDGATALDALRDLNAQDPTMRLTTKTYTGLGDLVESMYEKTNGTDERYWQYQVNGIEAQVGASAYVLKDTDNVEWEFKAYADEEQ